MKYRKGQWVIINETGEIGKIDLVFSDGNYGIELNGKIVIRNNHSHFEESELSPAPKTPAGIHGFASSIIKSVLP